MDSREFDDLIKNSLEGFSQLPEKEVKKAIFGKLFYQNLWVFHKMKLLASIVIISGGTALTYYYLDESQISDLNQDYTNENNNDYTILRKQYLQKNHELFDIFTKY